MKRFTLVAAQSICLVLAGKEPDAMNVERNASETIDIGSRLELLLDDRLIGELRDGASLELHHPVAREIALVHDAPWEGSASGYHTVFRDGDVVRMYYRGAHLVYGEKRLSMEHSVVCYAESRDGIHWTKPELGLVEFEGSTKNNILMGTGPAAHNFAPFKDTNPACPPEARYKAVGGLGKGLWAYQSADGIHWTQMSDEAVMTEGAFDSQNIAFWDPLRKQYREYHRHFREGRDIMTCTSDDFIHWSKPEFLEYTPGRLTELYTNQIVPYPRAPHIFIGLPARYIAGRGLLTELNRQIARASKRCGTDYTDTGLITSRDASRFHVWPEAFIRPGPETGTNWAYGNKYTAWGMIETASQLPGAPDELSFYTSDDGYWRDHVILRRFSMRIDGFVSLSAPMSGGEMLTKPIRFDGDRLELNVATSAAGSVRIEFQDTDGQPVEGFALDNCDEIYGDSLAREVTWNGNGDVSALAGRTIRLRFVLRDADVYSFRFGERQE
jgi:catechol 2,3-dioxygenase-like lactoylglutathione lyase family enzyme